LEKGINPRAIRPKAKPSLVRMKVRKRRILARSSVFIVMNLDIAIKCSNKKSSKHDATTTRGEALSS